MTAEHRTTPPLSAAKGTSNEPLFDLGALVATPGALALLKELGLPSLKFLARHWYGDWGDICTDDRNANRNALVYQQRIVSSYNLEGHRRLWIITEADRSSTTLLLPEEY